MFPLFGGKNALLWDVKPDDKDDSDLSEVELMKERFAKLLLGEDMSGGGKGVCTALAILNVITNLSATVFGFGDWSHWLRRKRQSDAEKWNGSYVGIVVGGTNNGDAYLSGVSSGRPSARQEDKWWLPYPKVPAKGLSDEARKKLQQCRDCTNQILKAALAINSNVLAEIEIPNAYLETLPKSGKSCMGDIIYRYITAEQFAPECLLDCLDLSSVHHTLEIANIIEASAHVWKLKDWKKHPNHQKGKHKSWGGKVKGLVADGGKKQFLSQRAETLLRSLRLRFPGLPQIALDMHKIQYNKDVGQSILESYSRVMESLAFNIIARIDDVLYVDDAGKQCAAEEFVSFFNRGGLGGLPIQKRMSPSPFSIRHTPHTSPFATPTFCFSPTLSGSPKKGAPNHKLEKMVGVDLDKLWTYAGNLSARRASGDPPERD